jgi:predicted 2-oxoglutarate/Fe(II)-dependent dioxygenase YbiX
MSGGEFVTYCDGAPVAHKMAQGDAILFHSEKLHNISTVTGGLRQSLVVELWPAKRF